MSGSADSPCGDNSLHTLGDELGVSSATAKEMRRETVLGRRSVLTRSERGEPWQVPSGHRWYDERPRETDNATEAEREPSEA